MIGLRHALLGLSTVTAALLLVPSAAATDCGIAADVGDTMGGAGALHLPVGACNGDVGGSDTADWYSFHAKAGQAMTANVGLSSSTPDVKVCFYDSTGGPFLGCADSVNPSHFVVLMKTAPSTGTYYLQVTEVCACFAGYLISLDLGRDDCNPGSGDAGPIGSGFVRPIAANAAACRAHVYDAFDVDAFSFSVASGEAISATVLPFPDFQGAHVCLFTPSDALETCIDASTGGSPVTITNIANTVSGAYKIEVSPVSTGYGYYELTVMVGSTSTYNDCGSGDAQDQIQNARYLAPPASCHGAIDFGGDEDYYQFATQAGDTIFASLTPDAGTDHTSMCLFLPSGTLINSGSTGTPPCNGAARAGTPSAYSLTASETGFHKLRVFAAPGSTGGYRLVVTVTTPNTNTGGQEPPVGDCGLLVDAPGTSASPALVAVPVIACNGSLAASDTEDWFRLVSTTGFSSVTVVASPSAALDLRICLQQGTRVGCSNTGVGGGIEQIALDVEGDIPVLLEVFTASGAGPYQLTILTAEATGGNGAGTGAGTPGLGFGLLIAALAAVALAVRRKAL